MHPIGLVHIQQAMAFFGKILTGYSPETIEVMHRVFDNAWPIISKRYKDEEAVTAGQRRLAEAT